jgi:hypothetical protein
VAAPVGKEGEEAGGDHRGALGGRKFPPEIFGWGDRGRRLTRPPARRGGGRGRPCGRRPARNG